LVKTMDLTVRERLLVGSFFPQKGSLRDQRIVKELTRKIALGEDERKEIGFAQDEGNVLRWDPAKAKPKEIEFNDDEREFLKRQIGRLDEEEAFTQDLLALADRLKEL
jgi:hypothetical protein